MTESKKLAEEYLRLGGAPQGQGGRQHRQHPYLG